MKPPILGRRRFLKLSASTLVSSTACAVFAPAVSRAADRPGLPHGVQSGDVFANGGMVWGRADIPARMQVEFSTTPSFRTILGGVFAEALPGTDFTAKAMLQGAPAGQDIFYRIRFQNHAEPAIAGEAMTGHFRTAPADKRSVSFVWSGDTAGQGWGIDEARGGMKCYAAMAKNDPDFFIHSGDTIYADGPIAAEQKMPDGGVWKNIVVEEKTKPAETLAEFRASYKYNLLDRNVRAFNAQAPGFYQWDDHEVTDNWWPEQPLVSADHRRKGYRVQNMLALTARASRAFHEYLPVRFEPLEPRRVYRKIAYGPLLDVFMLDMRSYRAANGANREAEYTQSARFLGPHQIAWLKRELKASKAVWKVIAADQPIGLYVADDWRTNSGSEAVAQNDRGKPLGRELEIADLLSFMKREKIANTVWLTADVHYTAAHYYNPDKAAFQDFEPFWEFVSGPLHAGTFGPNQLDGTFGPELKFIKAPSKEQGQNLPPSYGMQFFGHVAIDGKTAVMKVTLKDWNDVALWSVDMNPGK